MIKKYFFVAILLLSSIMADAQLKLYSRRMQLEDFSSQTLKVVVTSQSLLELTLKEEVQSRWTLSPFEFCDLQYYESERQNYGQYFLRFTRDAGLVFLEVTKSGKEDDPEMLKRGFDVVKIPVAAEGSSTGQEFQFMGAFLDLLQNFMSEAMTSEKVAYVGLSGMNSVSLDGKTIYLDAQSADAAMQDGTVDAVAGLCIVPSAVTFNSFCYKMLVTADTHQLLYFSKNKYQGPKDTWFTAKEEKSFEKRHGVIAR